VENQSSESPKVGDQHERTFTVEEKNCVEFKEKGIPPILSTPWLIWSMEHAAYDLLDKYLSDEEMSLGIHVDIEHLAVTPMGHQVTCKAKVIHVDRRVVNFQIEAFDEKELICKGVHKRQIVKSDHFQKAVEKKTKA
jgi:fluoroacetyl-CoA thioesterase